MCFMSDHRRRAVAGRRAVAVMVVASVASIVMASIVAWDLVASMVESAAQIGRTCTCG